MSAVGMVCLWPSKLQVCVETVLWVVGVSGGVCLGLLGWRPEGLLPDNSLCPVPSH